MACSRGGIDGLRYAHRRFARLWVSAFPVALLLLMGCGSPETSHNRQEGGGSGGGDADAAGQGGVPATGGAGGADAGDASLVALGGCVSGVSAGSLHTCARKSDGTVWCWGNNRMGQIGIGTDGSVSAKQVAPAWVSALGSSVAEVHSGDQFTCALKLDGTL